MERFLKYMFNKRSKLFDGILFLDHDLTTIETKVDLLLTEIHLLEGLSKKSVAEFNKLDIEVVEALLTTRLESAKAIQFLTMFLAFLFVSFSSILKSLFENPIKAILFISIAAAVTVVVQETSYRNNLKNITFLKELLAIYKKEKFDKQAKSSIE